MEIIFQQLFATSTFKAFKISFPWKKRIVYWSHNCLQTVYEENQNEADGSLQSSAYKVQLKIIIQKRKLGTFSFS